MKYNFKGHRNLECHSYYSTSVLSTNTQARIDDIIAIFTYLL
jgi:hypothetical protein